MTGVKQAGGNKIECSGFSLKDGEGIRCME